MSDFSAVFGREPMTMKDLVTAIVEKHWPAWVDLNPMDWAALRLAVPPIDNRFDEQLKIPYFVFGSTKVYPKMGKGKLDLSDWTPEEPRLIEFAR